MPIVYKATNLINNKVYIGQTIYSLEQRLNDAPYGHYYIVFGENKLNIKLNMFLHKALHKYGKDNFKFEVIEEQYFDDVNDRDKWLNEREIYWIAHYKSNQKEFGYNQTTGGHKHYHRTKECREKISKATKEAMSKFNTKELCNPMKNMTEKEKVAHKQKISNSTKKAMKRPEIQKKCAVWKGVVGRRWLTNGIVNRFVFEKDAKVLLTKGYMYGHIQKKRGGNL